MFIDNFWTEFSILAILVTASNSIYFWDDNHSSIEFKSLGQKIIGITIFILLPYLAIFYAIKLAISFFAISLIYIGFVIIIPLLTKFVFLRMDSDSLIGFGLVSPIVISAFIIVFGLIKTINAPTVTFPITNKHEIVAIDTSFVNLKNSFQQVENVIAVEKDKISFLLKELSKDIQTKKEDFESLKIREDELLKQIEYYKQISSINEKQADALIKSVKGNKLLDLGVAFLMGVISSILATILTNKNLRDNIFRYIKMTKSLNSVPSNDS